MHINALIEVENKDWEIMKTSEFLTKINFISINAINVKNRSFYKGFFLGS